MDSSTCKYTYGYDALSRLTSATYQGATPAEKYTTTYMYDKHGNIETLQRYDKTTSGAYGLVDSLTLHYIGNQLTNVTDSTTTAALAESNEFKKGSTANPGYAYNKNGAMTKDLNKKISNISYNSLDLPKELTFVSQPQSLVTTIGGVQFTLSSGGKALTSGSSTRTHTYTYAADGRKLRVVQGDINRDYAGSIIYENGSLKRILVDGGYIEGGVYHFNFNDHLGNTGVVANVTGTSIQRNSYYPFGLPMAETTNVEQDKQPYKYNGKEFDGKDGLNWMDYGARHYDAQLGRFTTMDPMAEKYYAVSPYAYCLNNPMRLVDPTGMWIETKNSWITNDPDEIRAFMQQSKYTTVTDAGHGDKPKNAKWLDPGTVDGENFEKDYALMVEEQLDYHLSQLGIKNLRTRTGDITVEGERVIWRYQLANSSGAKVLISIHLNSGSLPGLFSIYGKNSLEGKALAECIASQMKVLPLLGDGTRKDERGLGLLNGFKGTAVIIELGGIGNKQTIDAISSSASDIGYEIAKGVFMYLHSDKIEIIKSWFKKE